MRIPGKTWVGRVAVVSDVVDPATRTLHVRVVLAEPGRPHQACHVRFDTRVAFDLKRNTRSRLGRNS